MSDYTCKIALGDTVTAGDEIRFMAIGDTFSIDNSFTVIISEDDVKKGYILVRFSKLEQS